MKKSYFNVAILAVVITLCALPWGYTLVFASGPGVYHLKQVAYFNILAWGNGSFLPGLCAFLTCVTFVLAVVSIFIKNNKLNVALMTLSAITTVFGILPLIRTAEYITTISIVILVLLVANAVVAFLPNKKGAKKE